MTEVMLLEGFPLDSTVTRLTGVKGNSIMVVTSDHSSHRLLVCFDKEIKQSTLETLTFEDQDVVVCLDAALTDEMKQRLADCSTLKTV